MKLRPRRACIDLRINLGNGEWFTRHMAPSQGAKGRPRPARGRTQRMGKGPEPALNRGGRPPFPAQEPEYREPRQEEGQSRRDRDQGNRNVVKKEADIVSAKTRNCQKVVASPIHRDKVRKGNPWIDRRRTRGERNIDDVIAQDDVRGIGIPVPLIVGQVEGQLVGARRETVFGLQRARIRRRPVEIDTNRTSLTRQAEAITGANGVHGTIRDVPFGE